MSEAFERRAAPRSLREVELGETRPRPATTRAVRAAAPVRVAALRVARAPARSALVAGGIALATAMLVAVLGGSVAVEARALARTLADLPPPQRVVRVDAFGLAPAQRSGAARAARRALETLVPRPPVAAVAFRDLRLETETVRLGAIGDAGRWLRLTSGRAARRCSPARCEVVALGPGPAARVIAIPGIRFLVVGRGALASPAVLGDSFTRAPATTTILLASDVDGLTRLPALASTYRTDSWVVPLEAADVRPWGIASLLGREARAQTALERWSDALALTAPDDTLVSARDEGRVAARRMLLVGGEASALLLGFAVLAALSARRPLLAEWRRLEERGARRWQLWLYLATEAGGASVAGVVAGAAAGIVALAVVARRVDLGWTTLLAHGLGPLGTLLLLGGALVVSTAVVVATVRWPQTGPRAGPVRVGDVVALGALGAAALAAVRGEANASTLARGGTATLLLLLPALVSLVGAVLVGRVLAPAFRLAERAARRGGPAVRLALLALARAPARTVVAVAFLVVSLGLGLLAASYAATLDRGARDEAAYAVPLDARLVESSRLVGPLDAAGLGRYRALAPGVEPYPVLRRYGDVPGLGSGRISPVVLGLEPQAIARVHGWRGDFGSVPPRRLARLVAAGGPVSLAGPRVPADATRLTTRVVVGGVDVDLELALATPAGAIVRAPLRVGAGGVATAQVPPPARGGRLVALRVTIGEEEATSDIHREAEGVTSSAPSGSLALAPLEARSRAGAATVVTDYRGWIGRGGASAGRPGHVHYAFVASSTALYRPRQPTDGHPLPLVVSPDVARSASSGLVAIDVGGEEIGGRVVAVARRFPGTADGGGSFAIADESRLQTALDADAPGTGRPDELWLRVPAAATGQVAARLARPPFAAVSTTFRRAVQHELETSPLARGIAVTLEAAAVVAVALALAGLWLAVLGDLRDERNELYDLEAQGVEPGELRRQIRLRAAALGALGALGGLALGLVLSVVVVRLVQLSAAGQAPVPPLARDTGWATIGLGLATALAVGAALVEATVRRAFRDSTARPGGETL